MTEDNKRDPELKWLGWWGRFKYSDWIKACKTTDDFNELLFEELDYGDRRKDMYKYVRIALDLGADPNRRKDGKTFTGYAAWNIKWHDQEKIVMLLLKRGGKADDALRGVANSYCDEGARELAKVILDAGGDPNALDREGENALILACGNSVSKDRVDDDYTAMVRLLLEHGGDPNFKGAKYGTPLVRAANSGDGGRDIVKVLLENGADPALPDKNGTFPLITAAMSGSREIVKILFEKGVDPNQQTEKEGYTALMDVAQQARDRSDDNELDVCLDIIRMLIEHGAKTDLKDSGGRTAYDHAKRWGNETAMNLLKQMG